VALALAARHSRLQLWSLAWSRRARVRGAAHFVSRRRVVVARDG
jgi:hypothetical protein